jgi:GH24 family phage-related lysozyme (muramidase)
MLVIIPKIIAIARSRSKLIEETDKDPDGNPTIGYGHLCSSASCSEIKYSIPLSKADGDKLLQDDLAVSIPSMITCARKV